MSYPLFLWRCKLLHELMMKAQLIIITTDTTLSGSVYNLFYFLIHKYELRARNGPAHDNGTRPRCNQRLLCSVCLFIQRQQTFPIGSRVPLELRKEIHQESGEFPANIGAAYVQGRTAGWNGRILRT